MNYLERPKYHFKAGKGWMNDPNGLVYYKGWYHIFYQHIPDYEKPSFKGPTSDRIMVWGHARTKDFITYEELPVAIRPEFDYESHGCWSGTATVKDDVLYIFYASVTRGDDGADYGKQTVSMAYSTDGISFTKCDKNPIIVMDTPDGSNDFRDPAVINDNGRFYIVMASGHKESKEARLLLYESDDMISWAYKGIACRWENKNFAECPSFLKAGDKYLLATSVCGDDGHFFTINFGDFKDGVFTVENSASIDKGPDSYAGQVFSDFLGRSILMCWIPGWAYVDFTQNDVGCLSVPKEIKYENGKITVYPIKEIQHLLKNSDPAVKILEKGFTVERYKREPVICEDEIRDIKILRDGNYLEIFINGGEKTYSILL